AQDLADAGLKTLNVSIDAIDPDRFKAITRGGLVEPVLRGIEAARATGMEVKLNTVALNDFTMDDAIALIEYAREHDLETRFIEFMPLCGTGWKQDEFRPLTGLREALTMLYDLQPLPTDGGVAELYRIGNGPGRVGFIASLSANFCGACSRIRLTANGILRPCLFSQIGVDLRPLLLNDRADDELKRAFHEAVLNKPEGHGLKPENDWAGGETVSSWIRSTGG
ncbi:MAG: radical SAM protein, partial [bacterium]